MDASLTISIASAMIAVSAVITSLIALWKTHFARFRPICTAGDISFRVYPMRQDEQRWFMASVYAPISIANEGARPGVILGLRISLSFPDLPIPGSREIFYPRWEVDPVKFRQIGRERFEWIDRATLGTWMPFVVLPRTTVTKHLVFETRWEDPVVQDRVSFALEIYTDSRRHWTEIARCEMPLSASEWGKFLSRGTSLNVSAYERLPLEGACEPPDLHRYVASKEPIRQMESSHGGAYVEFDDERDESQSPDDTQ